MDLGCGGRDIVCLSVICLCIRVRSNVEFGGSGERGGVEGRRLASCS